MKNFFFQSDTDFCKTSSMGDKEGTHVQKFPIDTFFFSKQNKYQVIISNLNYNPTRVGRLYVKLGN